MRARAALFSAGLLGLVTNAWAHAQSQSSCAVETSSEPMLHIECTIPFADEGERRTLEQAASSLVRVEAGGRQCRWTSAPRLQREHEDAATFIADAKCSDFGEISLNLSYLAWNPAPHVSTVLVLYRGQQKASYRLAGDTRSISLHRGGMSLRARALGALIGVACLCALLRVAWKRRKTP